MKKKSQKGHNFLQEAQKHCGLPKKWLLSPVKTRFACLVISLKSFIENRQEIDYLYGQKAGVPAKVRKRKSTWQEWAVVEAVVIIL